MSIQSIRRFLVAVVAVTAIGFAGTAQADTATAKAKDRVSDTWLEAKLLTTIALNDHLSVFDIDADVTNKVATLTGVVASDVQKDLAGEVADSVEGITSVRNELRVDRGVGNVERADTSSRTFGQIVDDLSTTASIKTSFLANPNIDGLDINVDTMRDTVTLKGVVKSDAQRDLAEKIAQNTDGVVRVENKLRVDPRA